MKNIISIIAFISGLLAIPFAILMILEDNERLLHLILLFLMLPGFINSIRYLMKKVHFKVYFRIDE